MDQVSNQFRKLAERLVDLKQQQADPSVIEGACKAATLMLLKLREQFKSTTMEVERIKEETARHRSRLDQGSLQLDNLRYEKRYYEKEILNCENFQSATSDEAIGLLPLDEFLQAAPPEVVAGVAGDEHKLTLARLHFELEQRKALKAKLQGLLELKQQEHAVVSQRRSQLDDIAAHLRGVDSAAQPLRDALLPQLSLRSSHRTAELLPLPLYVLYSQFAAAQEVLGLPVRVSIAGSVEDAVRAAATAGAGQAARGDGGGDGADADGSRDHNHRTSGAAGGKRRRTSVPGTGPDDILSQHPLSVEVAILQDDGRSQLLQLQFSYYTVLKVVGATSPDVGDAMLLARLFPGDDGDGDMVEALAQLGTDEQLPRFGTPAACGRPYRWAQELAGVDFICTLPGAAAAGAAANSASLSGDERRLLLEGLAGYRRQQRVQALLGRVAGAKAAAAALK